MPKRKYIVELDVEDAPAHRTRSCVGSSKKRETSHSPNKKLKKCEESEESEEYEESEDSSDESEESEDLDESEEPEESEESDEREESEESEEREESEFSQNEVLNNNNNIFGPVIQNIIQRSQQAKNICNVDWSQDLTPTEYNKYKSEIQEIQDEINNMPSVGKIIKSHMSKPDKILSIEKLDLYNKSDAHDKLNLKYDLNKCIEQHTGYVLSETEVKKYKQMEVDLKHTYTKSLKYTIFDLNANDRTKSIIYNKYLHLQTLSHNDHEYPKLLNWIQWSILLPYNQMKQLPLTNMSSNAEINHQMIQIRNMLDCQLYGMDKIKEEILLILATKLTNPTSSSNGLALLGSPGTGKTSLIRALAKALNLPFQQISLGGMNDSSFIDGHGYTYEGSTPGIIVKSLAKLKCKNGIIFFDEFDKLSNSEHGKEVAGTLLHLIDPEQNAEFKDKYLDEIDIDLSHVWFIYSLNDDTLLNSALKDRIPIINVKGYTTTEKIQIINDYLLPRELENVGMKKQDIILNDDVVRYLITRTGNKDGVRDLKNMVSHIVKKVNFYRINVLKHDLGTLKMSFDIPNFKLPLTIHKKLIEQLLPDIVTDGPPPSMYM